MDLLKSVNVLNNLFGSFVKAIRMTEDPIELFKSDCVIMTVGNAFIGNNGKINVFVFFNAAVFLNFKSGAFCAEGEENRAVSEVIEMMINRRNSEGTKV